MSQLQDALNSARNGKGQVIFVIGDAGRGKTMLTQEFTRRATTADPDVVVLTGYCAAITGVGDPYLPFREALFRQTGGHALFTVELFHAMQERGDLRQDEHGRWVEGQAIDWTTLPLKVEGAIERRIEALDGELQSILTAASVEGEIFTAEVLARVQQLDQRWLVRQLGRELDKRHRLVAAHAMEWLTPGRQRISMYRFRNQLFQHYLYHRLDDVERAYLHEAVGYALEQLYVGQTEELAHPYSLALTYN